MYPHWFEVEPIFPVEIVYLCFCFLDSEPGTYFRTPIAIRQFNFGITFHAKS